MLVAVPHLFLVLLVSDNFVIVLLVVAFGFGVVVAWLLVLITS